MGRTKVAPARTDDDYRVIWTNRENIVTPDQWLAWLAAGCPRDDQRPERDSDYKPTRASGGTKVRPPYHQITDDGTSHCSKCGREVVKAEHTRSGLKHKDGWQ